MQTLSKLLTDEKSSLKDQYDTLNLSDNPISDNGMHSIKQIMEKTKIKHLNLSSNMISEAGFEKIVDELSKNQYLKTLDLGIFEGSIRKNSFGIDGAKCIAALILQNKNIESIKL
jgi:Ran GTPase-activating protein (RanGAP) involved in mRNA processing and transport